MPRVLVTGITGFAGSHLAELLVSRGDEVHGLAHERPPFANLASVRDRVRIHEGDITRLDDVQGALAGTRPDAVVHLAGMAVPTMAAADPIAAVGINVLGTATLLTALEQHPRTRVVLASSADVYGAPDRVPVDEDAPLRPANVYAATKVAAEALTRELATRHAAPVVILRPANQNGPRQHPGLAASAFAKQIAEAEAGLAEPVVKHGRLDAERDFVDVRDMARAYAAAMELGESGTFNVGTGRAVSIAEILDTLLGLARIPVRAELDPTRVRGGDPTRIALDATRFRQKTDWSPRIALADSLRDTLEHWRSSIRDKEGARA
ncbi:MAG: NAD-dependent epimerase/dehydratase family protein [Chloroflexi bacterium]|nr:MAG: NAD-dependent epimerase/dehydratase family protein [Chloroflexota bacterium]